MKRHLGIDYGTKTIGLAIGLGDLVRPFTILQNKAGHEIEQKAIEVIVNAVHDEEIDVVVLGLPLLNSSETKASKKVREFGNRLKRLLPPEIEFKYVDEQFSSQESLETAINIGVSRKNRKNDHALAACGILKRYFAFRPI